MTAHFAKEVCDLVTAGAVVAILLGWLPAIAATVTIIYTLVRLYYLVKYKGQHK